MEVRKKNTLSPRGNDDKLKKLIANGYEDVMSPAFSKSASTVKRILLKKNPSLRLTDRFVRDTLNEKSTTCAQTRLIK